jgi:hypothetical protein
MITETCCFLSVFILVLTGFRTEFDWAVPSMPQLRRLHANISPRRLGINQMHKNYGVCGEQNGTEIGFSPGTPVYPVSILPPIVHANLLIYNWRYMNLTVDSTLNENMNMERSVWMRNLYNSKWNLICVQYVFLNSTLLVAQLVEALRYKPEGRGFFSGLCHWKF